MATAGNWGKGRNLRVKAFEGIGHDVSLEVMNAWLQGLEEEQIIDISFAVETYGSPLEEHFHIFVTYTLE